MNNIENINNGDIDITPSTNIYNTFEHFDYKVWDAIAEFVDNSTQSFKNNKHLLKNITPKIIIYYDFDANILQIMDNCFGIDPNNIDKILKINVPNQQKRSRNEFGMGLKTAAFWFGRHLSINSVFVNSNKCLMMELNLDELNTYKNNKVGYRYENLDSFNRNWIDTNGIPFQFGTIVNIRKIKNKMTEHTLMKTASIFASRYRNDFASDNLEIRVIFKKKNNLYDANTDKIKENVKKMNTIDSPWNAKKLEYKPIKIKTDDKTGEEIKISINDSFKFENEIYEVNGWIGIAEIGSRNHPGLTLFRNGRTIKGDDSKNIYKPEDIFKDPGSYEYQRIIGWLNVDDFPVTQQKNDFSWNNGLEEKFIEFLLEKIKNNKENIDLFKMARTTKQKMDSNVVDNLYKDQNIKKFKESFNNEDSIIKLNEVEKVQIDGEEYIKISLSDSSHSVATYTKDIVFLVKHINEKDGKDWIQLEKYNEDEYVLILNMGLEFFSPFNNQLEIVRDLLTHLTIYLVYSEIWHSKHGGCDDPSSIRHILNKCIYNKMKVGKK